MKAGEYSEIKKGKDDKILRGRKPQYICNYDIPKYWGHTHTPLRSFQKVGKEVDSLLVLCVVNCF